MTVEAQYSEDRRKLMERLLQVAQLWCLLAIYDNRDYLPLTHLSPSISDLICSFVLLMRLSPEASNPISGRGHTRT